MLGYCFHIFFDYGLYHLQFGSLKALVTDKFNWKQVELCFRSAFHNMHMNGRMVVGVKLESVSKQSEYCWHINQIFCKDR